MDVKNKHRHKVELVVQMRNFLHLMIDRLADRRTSEHQDCPVLSEHHISILELKNLVLIFYFFKNNPHFVTKLYEEDFTQFA